MKTEREKICPINKKIISLHIEWCIVENVLVCAIFSSKLAHGTKSCALLRIY